MKKIVLLLVVIVLSVFTLAACSGAPSPSPAWADYERLTYKIQNTDTNENLGTVVMETMRKPSDKTLDGREYACDSRTKIIYKTDKLEIETTILSRQLSVLALSKTYKDLENETNSYTLSSRHEKKNYFYSLNGGAEQKMKTGASGYTDGEFLYHYLRCYDLNAVPAAIKIADPLTHSVVTVTSAYSATKEVEVMYPDGLKKVICNIVAIGRSDAPKGQAIFAYFTPDDAKYNLEVTESISKTKKIPVKMVENDITYVLSEINMKKPTA